MNMGLLALDENLASSIALRYASQLVNMLTLQLQAGHVEVPDKKQHSGGTGWVRRTWERGLQEAGQQAVQRLLNTEKVPCPFIGSPKVFIGDRDKEFLAELGSGRYDLFIEGNLNTSDINNFYELISSPLYTKTPCPIMVVKNLVSSDSVALLCGDGVDHQSVIPKALSLLKGDALHYDLIFYRYQETEATVSTNKDEAGTVLVEAEKLLQAANIKPANVQVVTGTPESVAAMLKKYCLVATSFPVRKTPRLELLAQCPSPILLCKNKARKSS
ncbi:MAG: hypothetical protein KKD73_14410 [Proteobacteria bacterium]|nr:hypothetical protein [Pseudomonadota bacterium]MBU1641269.1 hypothetical protein [Pseudomonadota bacterium]